METHKENTMIKEKLKKSNTEKYLSKYAEKEILCFDNFNFEFSNVITIPALNEDITNIRRVTQGISDENTLIILIVNAQEDTENKNKISNEMLINTIKENSKEVWKPKNSRDITLHQTKKHPILLIDRSTKGLELPNKTGVGLARKIAADIALKLISDNKIKTKWIHCTDADTKLPMDYFQQTCLLKNASAAIYPYIHSDFSGENKNLEAMFLYELFLRHYTIGLKYSKSNYAFHTIGSTIAINADAYANVRGFPIKESGEDFYLLNKLAKTGKIQTTKGTPIEIDGRISKRTPFGTGRSIEKILTTTNKESNFLFYDAVIFEQLKVFNEYIQSIDKENSNDMIELFYDRTKKNISFKKTLEQLGAFKAIDTAKKCSNKKEIQKTHLNTWFDSFRTLKFVHLLRDIAHPSVPLNELIQHPLYQRYNLSSGCSLEELLDQFREIENT